MIGDGLKPSGVNVTAITSEVGGNATIPSSPLELKNEAPAKDESLLNSNNAPDSNPIDMSTKLVDENIHHLTDFTTGLFGKNGHQSALPGIDFGKAIPPGLSLMEVLAGLDAEEKKLVHAVLNSNELLTSPGEAKSSNLALGEIHAEGVPVSPKAGINTPSKSLSIRKPGLNLNAAPHGKDLVGDESAHKLSSPGKPQAMADEEQSFPLKPFKDTAKILVDGNESPVHRATRGIKPAPLSGTQKPNVEGLASHDLPSTDLSKLSGSKDSTENLSDKVLSPSPSHSRFKHD